MSFFKFFSAVFSIVFPSVALAGPRILPDDPGYSGGSSGWLFFLILIIIGLCCAGNKDD